MRDYLHTVLSENDLFEMSSLALAHIGDAVFELMVRNFFAESGTRRAAELHKKTIAAVSAEAQERAANKILPLLSENEKAVFTRGRNAKVNSVPKHASYATYHTATAFEALWGYLYLTGKYDRLNELFSAIEL